MSSPVVTYLIPRGHIRCFLTGSLRKETPEEHVRQRWARSLIDEYGYSKDDVALEFPIQMGVTRKRADIVVFKPGSNHIQDNIVIILETKRDDINLSDKSKGDGQLKSYMAASVSCKFGLWVGKARQAYEKNPDGELVIITDIPLAGEDRPRRPERKDLQVTHDLTAMFRRCHNYIHVNGGFQKAEAFHEMLKLIFCKMYDEEESAGAELNFAVDPKEQRSESGRRKLLEDRIRPLFSKVKDRFPHIFEENEQIRLEPLVLAYVVAEMQYISLTETETDVKGAAYEELVGQNLRGDRGEYFTPRNVCDMTVKIIQSMFHEDALSDLKVIDCCCGTGGFLVSWIDNLRRIIRRQETTRNSRDIEGKIRRRVRDACARSMFGMDINPFLVRTAQMNLVMHGDGSTNIFRADSSRSPGEWSDEARKKVPYGRADIVLTNPPFGSEVKIDDAHVLDGYELTNWETKNRRGAIPAEQLFVEKAMACLREGGYLGIVLPDGILNNPSLRFLRSWLLRRGRIVASVDLPKETFAVSGGVNNPSVLIVQKFTKEEVRRAEANIFESNHTVFMAAPKTAGIDKRGTPIFLRHLDGREITDNDGNKYLDDEISAIPEKFYDWLASRNG